MTNGYPPDWDSRRREVYARDNYKCVNCGRKGGSSGQAELHAHHIVPKSKGGGHKLSNLTTVCKKCHDAIHGKHGAPRERLEYDITKVKNVIENVKKYDINEIENAKEKLQSIYLRNKLVEMISRYQEFIQQAKKGVGVTQSGKIADSELEEERISLIQDLGEFSMNYEAPDDKREQAMDNFIFSLVEYLRFPEDSVEKYKQQDLSPKEAKQICKEMMEKRSNKQEKAVEQLQSLGLASFFKNLE